MMERKRMGKESCTADPLVSVGLPCYNRAHGLRQALASICHQTYRNWDILVFDNDSPDPAVGAVIEEFQAKEPRIIAHKMKTNLGWLKNFCYVFETSTSEDYFMWACDDDIWGPTFIETGIKTLQEKPEYDAWCCTVDNVDMQGRCIHHYLGFSRFTSTDDKRRDIVQYLREPEGMGTANIYYSIYRMDRIRAMMREFCFTNAWGSDMAFNLGFLARNRLIAVDEVLLHKGVPRTPAEDLSEKPVMIDEGKMNRWLFPPKHTLAYLKEYYQATRYTPYKNLVLWVMLSRVPYAVYRHLIKRCVRIGQSIRKRLWKLKVCAG